MPVKIIVPPGTEGDAGQSTLTASPGVVVITQEEEAEFATETPQRLVARAVEILGDGPVAGAV
jgi:hypothetical protein